MAATVSVQQNTVFGNRRVTVSEVTLDNSYATGGLAVTPSQLGLTRVVFASTTVKTPAGAAVNAYYDTSTSKIKALGASAEIAALTDLSALVVQVVAYGN